jgi:hypothetical protein
MPKPDDNQKVQAKQAVFQAEVEKLSGLFAVVDPAKKQLCDGLILDAAYLASENWALRQILEQTGMVRVHPERPELQKPIEAGKQYRQNVMAYAVCIKALNGVLSRDTVEQDDEFDEFVKKHQQGDGSA